MRRIFACLATPPGEGGIHVVLFAGAGARELFDSVFRGASETGPDPDPRLAYGRILDGEEVVDEVLVAGPFPTARGERFEIDAHGGPAAADAVLDLLAKRGARVLSAQRFDRRFPAPADTSAAWRARVLLQRARTLPAASVLAAQEQGALARALAAAANGMRRAARGDREAIAEAHRAIESLLASAPLGRALVRPPEILLLGPPNAGKSTLFNRLARRERALVDPRPGTTRDRLREVVDGGGVPFALCDSAGLAEASTDPLEAAGAEASRRAAPRAALRMFLFDGARPSRPAECEAFEGQARPRLAAVGKSDLHGARAVRDVLAATLVEEVHLVSGKTGAGCGDLLEAARRALGMAPPGTGGGDAPSLLGGRVEALLREGREALAKGDAAALRRIAAAIARRAGG